MTITNSPLVGWPIKMQDIDLHFSTSWVVLIIINLDNSNYHMTRNPPRVISRKTIKIEGTYECFAV